MNSIAKTSGKIFEDIALNYLQNQGLHLITRNFFSRFGEIDIIMSDLTDLVFVEVRKRKTLAGALESVTKSKQTKLINTARYYLAKVGREVYCRFDVVVIDDFHQLEWFKNVIFL